MLDVNASTDANSPNMRAYNWIDQQSPLSGAFSDQEEAIRQMQMGGERAEMQPAAGGAMRPSTAAPSNSTAPSKSQQKARPSTAAVGVGVSVQKLGAYLVLKLTKIHIR